jgi:hypothetical protein
MGRYADDDTGRWLGWRGRLPLAWLWHALFDGTRACPCPHSKLMRELAANLAAAAASHAQTQPRRDLDMVMEVLLGELTQRHPAERQRCQWVMGPETFDWLEKLSIAASPPRPITAAFHPLYPLGQRPPEPSPPMLLGLPIDVRDGATGIRLEPRSSTSR